MGTAPAQDPASQQAIGDVVTGGEQVVADARSGDVQGALAAAESTYEQVAPLAPAVIKEAKAGYKTTEFWLVIAWELLTQLEAIPLPGTWGKVVAGATGVIAYVLSRGIAKSGTPSTE